MTRYLDQTAEVHVVADVAADYLPPGGKTGVKAEFRPK
jgi:hypothetical protein